MVKLALASLLLVACGERSQDQVAPAATPMSAFASEDVLSSVGAAAPTAVPPPPPQEPPSPIYMDERDWLALVDAGRLLDAARAYPKLAPDRRSATILHVAPATSKKFEAAAKAAERAKHWDDAIALRQTLVGLGDMAQIVVVSDLEKKKRVATIEAEIVVAEESKNWRTLAAAYADLERVTGRKMTAKIRGAEAKAKRAEREAAHARAVDTMSRGARLADSTRVTIGATEWRKCLRYSCARAPARFLLVQLGVINDSNDTIHANPHNVTLASCGQEAPVNTETYSITNHLPAVNVAPGNNAQGWLVFLVDPSCDHVLYYRSLGSGEASIPVVGPIE